MTSLVEVIPTSYLLSDSALSFTFRRRSTLHKFTHMHTHIHHTQYTLITIPIANQPLLIFCPFLLLVYLTAAPASTFQPSLYCYRGAICTVPALLPPSLPLFYIIYFP